ncbi:uncharacterized protein FIBRA_06512 [Fibroporia radiculosa]|uniref:C2H2-type domain-containing protein n=1 Tax=Fibroporia radiculosa TaxID=599839 RepID=J4GSV8_9APHY|nr:uncharacterized protein FIBRA_06512 [Fibroporia radiculosa]CCM04340.1 predicted protein [Fibroporia radiculosa]
MPPSILATMLTTMPIPTPIPVPIPMTIPSPPIQATPSLVHPARTPCLWGDGTCHIALDDLSPAGLTRHLKAFHFTSHGDPWGNKRRGLCAWGAHCDAQEMNFESFGKHVAAVHLRSTAQRCPWCGRGFARADTLARHMLGTCPYAEE